jgi:hypothetical protein
MKKLLIMLLFTITTFAQSTLPIKGVTLKYNSVNKTMLLSMSDTTFLVPENSNIQTEVKIVRDLKVNNESIKKPYFITSGYKQKTSWFFVSNVPKNSKSISPKNKLDYIYEFSNVEPGEYILTITTKSGEKVVEKLSTSLIVK